MTYLCVFLCMGACLHICVHICACIHAQGRDVVVKLQPRKCCGQLPEVNRAESGERVWCVFYWFERGTEIHVLSLSLSLSFSLSLSLSL